LDLCLQPLGVCHYLHGFDGLHYLGLGPIRILGTPPFFKKELKDFDQGVENMTTTKKTMSFVINTKV
jgi:hypothetical protein